MREPTRNEMITGIAQGVHDFLLTMSAGKYGDGRPLQLLRRAVESAVTKWMHDNAHVVERALERDRPDLCEMTRNSQHDSVQDYGDASILAEAGKVAQMLDEALSEVAPESHGCTQPRWLRLNNNTYSACTHCPDADDCKNYAPF